MRSWQVLYLSIVLAGLVIGWLSERPLVGLAFIWVSLIVTEVFYSKKRSVEEEF
jgi:hypothetical protein